MKYLIITYSDFSYLHGQNIRAYYFIKELLKQKEEVHLVVIKSANISKLKKLFSKNITIHTLNFNISRFNKFKLFQYATFFVLMPFFIKKLLKKVNPHIIYAQNLLQGFSVALIKNNNFYFAYDVFDLYFDFFRIKINVTKNNPIVLLLRKLEKITLKKSNIVFTISNTFKQYIIKNFKVTSSKIKVVYEGADIKLFNPQDKNLMLMKKYKINKNDIVISFVGGIEKHDGLDSIIYAGTKIIKKYNNIKFLFIGKGGYLKQLIKLTQKHNLYSYCIFTGWVEYKHINKLLSITDIAILPLKSSDSTNVIITTKLYEYLSAGKAIIAPALSGIQEIIKHKKNGILFTPNNSSDLEKKIIFLINNYHVRKKISVTGRKLIIKYYQIEKLTNKMYQFIKENFRITK